jgi:hypothetical protein
VDVDAYMAERRIEILVADRANGDVAEVADFEASGTPDDGGAEEDVED